MLNPAALQRNHRALTLHKSTANGDIHMLSVRWDSSRCLYARRIVLRPLAVTLCVAKAIYTLSGQWVILMHICSSARLSAIVQLRVQDISCKNEAIPLSYSNQRFLTPYWGLIFMAGDC
jgi:hypothetical protein